MSRQIYLMETYERLGMSLTWRSTLLSNCSIKPCIGAKKLGGISPSMASFIVSAATGRVGFTVSGIV
jgi:hypothetical protein